MINNKYRYFLWLVIFIFLTSSSYADLGLDSSDFNGERVTGQPVTGPPVNQPGDGSTDGSKGGTDSSGGSGGQVSGMCPINGGSNTTEDTGCGPCSEKGDQHVKVKSYVNLFSREYQDEKVDMSVKVAGGMLKVYRVYFGGKWIFEHEYNSLDLSAALAGNIVKSTYTYRQDQDGHYRYKTYTIKKVGDQYRWENKEGEYTLYSKEGKLIEGGNRFGVRGQYIYKDNKLTTIQDHNSSPIFHFEYSENGKIAKALDEHGRVVSYNWQDDKLLEVTDVLGHVTKYGYSPEGQLISKSDEAGREFFITYHPDGAVQSVLSKKGGGHYFSYKQVENGGGQYAKVTTSMGSVREYWYYENGDTKKIAENGTTIREDQWHKGKRTSINELGSRTIETYDTNENLIQVDYVDGTNERYKYDSKNNLISSINELGVENRYSYTSKGLLKKQFTAYKTPEQFVTTYQYDKRGNLLNTTVYNGEKGLFTQYVYDEKDNLIQIIDALGGNHRLEYDFQGNVTKSIDPVGLTTNLEYDLKGNPISATSPNKQKYTFSYDAADRKISSTDNGGTTTHFSYDLQDNLTKIKDGLGGTNSLNFDKDNRLTKKVDQEGKYQIFFYEEGSRRISKVIDGSGNEIDITYRGFADCGNCAKTFRNKPVRIEFPTFTRQFKYDQRGRLIEKIDVQGKNFLTEKYVYDKGGRLISTSDRNGLVTTKEYDTLNRVTSITDPTGGKTLFTYDPLGKLIELVDAKGQTTKFEYDLLGNKIKEIRPLGNNQQYLYDSANRLLQRTDGEGHQISYFYNKETGQLDGYSLKKGEEVFLGEAVNFSYDPLGRLAGYDDGTTSAKFEYDALGRRLKVETKYPQFTASHSYSYYKNSQKKSYTGPDGRTHNYTYTPINTLNSITIDGAGKIQYGDYNWLRPQKVTYPGLERKDSYDEFLRLTGRTTTTKTTKVLDLAYTYNNTNNIISRTSSGTTTEYNYDELERLIGVSTENEQAETYEFDPVGNRLATSKAKNYTYDENNQLLAVGETSYSYDKNGNTIQKKTDDSTSLFTYNFENRLSSLKRDGLQASYYYDPFGRRLSKKVNGKITWFGYSDEGLIAEYNDTGSILATYTWKPGSTWSTDPIMLTKSGKDYFYHNDHLGAPNALTDTKGKLVWQAKYDVYGDVKITTEEVRNNLRLPGQFFDEETGLYYNWHRYYDPETGRYTKADPIGLAGGVNLFAYVGGDPVNWIDPWGLKSYLVSRPLDGIWGGVGSHNYIVTNADFLGDPNATVYSFGKTESGMLGRVYDNTTGFSEGTHEDDKISWSSLEGLFTNFSCPNVSLINAPDFVVDAYANSMVENQRYEIIPDKTGVNSNTAAQAIANRSADAYVRTPGDRLSPGARVWTRIDFTATFISAAP